MRVLLTLAFIALAEPAFAAQSIVGKWAPSKADCQDPERQLRIRPMSIGGGFSCEFKSVKRKGDVVTWGGHCFSQDGDRRPEAGEEVAAMVAKLKNGKLMLSGLGLGAGPLLRCK